MRAVRAISGFPTTPVHTGEGISLKEITGVGVSYDGYYTRQVRELIVTGSLTAPGANLLGESPPDCR